MEALGTSPIGSMDEATSRADPGNGWLLCDGRALSRSTYAALFGTLVPALGTVTITANSPTMMLTAHGLTVGDALYFTGTVPAGLAANTIYYVRTAPSSSTFTVTAAPPTANPTTWASGAADATPTAGGTPTLMSCPFGLGDGSTTFNLPDTRGRIPFAPDNMGTAMGAAGRLPNSQSALGRTESGEESVLLASTESGMVGHDHGGATAAGVTGAGTTGSANAGSNSETAAHSHNFSSNMNDESSRHTHQITYSGANYSTGNANNFNQPDSSARSGAVATDSEDTNHSHNFSGSVGATGTDHTHTYTVPSLGMPSLSVPQLAITTENRPATAPHNNVPPVLAASQIIRVL